MTEIIYFLTGFVIAALALRSGLAARLRPSLLLFISPACWRSWCEWCLVKPAVCNSEANETGQGCESNQRGAETTAVPWGSSGPGQCRQRVWLSSRLDTNRLWKTLHRAFHPRPARRQTGLS